MHLSQAMQARGLTLIARGKTHNCSVTASHDLAAWVVQDYAIVTQKTYSLSQVVAKMRQLIGPQITIVSWALSRFGLLQHVFSSSLCIVG